jgi:glucokinase
VLAVAIEPSRLAAGLVDASGEVLVRDRVGTPSREIWRALEQLVRRVLAARPDEVGPPSVVGVSCSGPLDLAAGSVSPAALPAWTSFALRDRLADLTGLPVLLDTTAGAFAEGERRFGDTTDSDSYFALLLDHEVESACIVGGIRLRGAHGNAGSLAHVCVDPAGPRCTCGATGCLRALAAQVALEAELNRPLRRATASIIERTGIMVGRAVASAAAVFDVTTFLVAGSVVDTFGDGMLDVVRREAAARSKLDHLAGLEVLEPSGYLQPLTAAAAVAFAAPAPLEPDDTRE